MDDHQRISIVCMLFCGFLHLFLFFKNYFLNIREEQEQDKEKESTLNFLFYEREKHFYSVHIHHTREENVG